jgi:chorismate mutase/prephenate dehydrogenase
VKRSTGRGTRDYGRERDVILAARVNAARVGVPPDTAEELMRLLIRTSLTTQEQASVAALGGGAGQRVLVIGGAGKMGGWFVQFLSSQGFDVEVADPAPVPAGLRHITDWHSSDLSHDFIIVATPRGATNRILAELATRPRGVIFDVGSLVAPCWHDAPRAAGLKVTSVHPMFGPTPSCSPGAT